MSGETEKNLSGSSTFTQLYFEPSCSDLSFVVVFIVVVIFVVVVVIFSPPDKAVIVTTEERTQFVDVCKRIEEVVTYQVQNFRTVFPFCCPKADLRTTLKLFDMVGSFRTCVSQVAKSQNCSRIWNE